MDNLAELKETWKNAWGHVEEQASMIRKDPNHRTHDREVSFIFQQVNHFDTFIDCGVGTAGSEAWSILDRLPNCEVIGFEAQSERFALLKDIYPGKIYNKCISNKVGTVSGFMGSREGKSDFWLRATEKELDIGAYNQCAIESTTVDDLLNDNERKVMIWADIEGSEPDMILGSMKNIKKGQILGFFLETSPKTLPYIDRMLLPFGYKKKQYRECGTHADWLYYL